MSGRIAAKIDWATDWDRDAALTTAKLLLEIKAVNFRPEEPYTLTSGWKSPVYIDCRKIIYFPRARAKICDLAVEKIARHVGIEAIQAVAGGETAGIPFAAWIAERMHAPMAYVRKQPKGFGRNALIEGDVPEGLNTLLVEDLTTDGGSKIQFCKALREAGAICNHTFVVFFYGVFPDAAGARAWPLFRLRYNSSLQATLDQPGGPAPPNRHVIFIRPHRAAWRTRRSYR